MTLPKISLQCIFKEEISAQIFYSNHFEILQEIYLRRPLSDCMWTMSMYCLWIMSMYCIWIASMYCIWRMSMYCIWITSMYCIWSMSMYCIWITSMYCIFWFVQILRFKKMAVVYSSLGNNFKVKTIGTS